MTDSFGANVKHWNHLQFTNYKMKTRVFNKNANPKELSLNGKGILINLSYG